MFVVVPIIAHVHSQVVDARGTFFFFKIVLSFPRISLKKQCRNILSSTMNLFSYIEQFLPMVCRLHDFNILICDADVADVLIAYAHHGG
jgi:hypothetical protein